MPTTSRLSIWSGAVAVVLFALPALAADKDIPCTASGKPDLSGTYDVATLTPLQRPTQFGDNLYLTREQALAIEKQEQELMARGLEKSDPDRGAPAEGGAAPVGFDDGERESFGAGNVGGYNSFWIDRGEDVFAIDGKMRTSIITEPRDDRRGGGSYSYRVCLSDTTTCSNTVNVAF